MTIQVTVANDDASTEQRPLYVYRSHRQGAREACGVVTTINPGEKLSMHVWRGSSLVVSEEHPDHGA